MIAKVLFCYFVHSFCIPSFSKGNGFITIEVLREILQELDEKLTDDDLDSMIDEIDTDGSGTVDWEGWYKLVTFTKTLSELLFSEFKAVMIG